MSMRSVIVTNNPLVRQKYGGAREIAFVDGSYMDVLTQVRDKVHQGHKLLTHPLSGSVKPGETPYKSVMIAQKRGTMDMQSLSIIEEAIATVRKFQDKTAGLPPRVLQDFQLVDFTLIDSALPSADVQ